MIFNNLKLCPWARRLSHQINLFRGGYVVRHQSEDYNLSVALRQSALQSLFTFFGYLPLAVIGFEPIFSVHVPALFVFTQKNMGPATRSPAGLPPVW